MKAWVFFALFLLACAATDAAETETGQQVLEMPMQGYAGHFREHCMDLRSGQTLQLVVRSPYPVQVNVHHHAGHGTEFLLDEIVGSPEKKAVDIADDGEYCLEVRNSETRPAAFDLEIEYRLTAD